MIRSVKFHITFNTILIFSSAIAFDIIQAVFIIFENNARECIQAQTKRKNSSLSSKKMYSNETKKNTEKIIALIIFL